MKIITAFALLLFSLSAQAQHTLKECVGLSDADSGYRVTVTVRPTYWIPSIESYGSDNIILEKTYNKMPQDSLISRVGFRTKSGDQIWIVENENYILILTDTTDWKSIHQTFLKTPKP